MSRIGRVVEVGRGAGSWLSDHALLTFLLLSTIGACYEFFFYLEFRLNILQFAEPLDLLFAAIRQPVVVTFTLLPLALLWILNAVDRWVRTRVAWYRRLVGRQETLPGYAAVRPIVYGFFVLVYFVYFTLLYAQNVAGRLRQGHGRTVQVELMAPGAGAGPRILRGTLLGTTARWVFVFEPRDSSTHAIPAESITEMTMLRRPGTGRVAGGADSRVAGDRAGAR